MAFMQAGLLMTFLLQVPGFILVHCCGVVWGFFFPKIIWKMCLFFPKEGIRLPPPPQHILEIHIKQLQVNTCERMAQSRLRGRRRVWIPQALRL